MIRSISIIVSTYNRADRLVQTLESIKGLKTPTGVWWELIIVDNNSNDETARVARTFAAASGLNVQYVFEPRQGLSRARNAGLSRACGDIVAFTDDDCIVDPSWLVAMTKEFERDPGIGGVGGRVELFDPADKPATVRTFRDFRVFKPTQQFILIIG